MKKQPLKYEDVASIADNLKKHGKMPSLLDLTSALKKTKISSKLLQLLEEWYQRQLDTHPKEPSSNSYKEPDLPILLPKKFETLSQSLSLLQSIFEFSSHNRLSLQEDEIEAIHHKFTEINQYLRFIATHDELTELPNGIYFTSIAEKYIQLAHKKRESMAFLFLDLDHFKMINHTLGYAIGNQVLQVVAHRLQLIHKERCIVARYGGDEFIILVTKIQSKDQAKTIAQQIMQVLKLPFKVDEHVVQLSASIGMSIYPEHGEECESLISHAEFSLYHAKEKGDTYQLFSQEVNRAILNRSNLRQALQQAIKRKELYLVYQPIINCKTQCVESVEALLRWNSKDYGPVSPAEFIPIAESSDLILKIGEWVLEQACAQAVRWHQQGLKNLTVAVNLSGRQFRRHDLIPTIAHILDKTKLPAQYLEFELTENTFIETTEHVLATLQKFKNMGIKLSIDDFGTGYSCLSYLKRFPVDKIKIDKVFIHDLAKNPNNAVIIKTIIRLGHHLHLKILAEGVETSFQNKFVVAQGCDYTQGFYFQTPEKPELLFEFLQQHANK